MKKQTTIDLKNHLAEQIEFLKRSCESYDEGFKSEAKRLAVVIRVLLHDTKKSKSLLKQLNKKDILFYDISLYSPNNLIQSLTLVGIEATSKWAKFIPLLDDGPSICYKKGKVTFDDWWKGIVFVDGNSNEMTRKHLILAICNKDGGAHIDPNLNEVYANITRNKSLGRHIFNSGDGNKTEITNPEFASIRHIAHEVLKSLADEFPEYFQ